MATVNNRPFPCADNAFIDSVLDDHKKTATEHNNMVIAYSGTSNPAPYVFTYSQHQIPTDCNGYYVKITFDPTNQSNQDINVEFPQWPEDAGNPVSISGEVYFTIAFFNGVRNRYGAASLQLRKAIETNGGGNYVTVVVRGLDSSGHVVYNGNLTSQFPFKHD